MEKKRFCVLCLFALSVFLSAWALPPDGKRVTLDLKEVPVEKFLSAVKEKAGINMLYNSKMFKGTAPVTVKATDEEWRHLLDRVLSPLGFTYAMKDKIVVIKKKGQDARVLNGKVIDEAGEGLPGVSVMILGKERNIGTTTGVDGDFSLGIPDGPVVVRLSFMGMQPLEVHADKLDLEKTHTFRLTPETETSGNYIVY